MRGEYGRLAQRLVEALRGYFGQRLVSVVFYGSAARGDARQDSDLDVLIVVEGLPPGRLRRQELFLEVEEGLSDELEMLRSRGIQVDFSPILLTPEEASRLRPLYLDMVHDAYIAYDRGGFFASILDRLRRRLEELGARRVRVGRLWYWDLKPDYKFGEVIEIE